MRGSKRPLSLISRWFRRKMTKVKAFLGVTAGIVALVFIRSVVGDYNNLFVDAEASHTTGILLLIYKLTKGEGLSCFDCRISVPLYMKVIISGVDTIQVTTPNGESDIIRARLATKLLIEGWKQKKQAEILDKDERNLF